MLSGKNIRPDAFQTTLATQAINRILKAEENDPFSILGPHQTANGVELRVFIPNAQAVHVVDAASQMRIAEMIALDPQGFFCVLLTDIELPFHYQLDVQWSDSQLRLEDPYRFEPLLTALDNWLLAEGTHHRPYEQLGAHPMIYQQTSGVRFSVWAPNARRVAVIGEFNHWDNRRHPMRLRRESGVWEIFLPDAQVGQLYKFELIDCYGCRHLKADPYAHSTEMRPGTASRISPMPVGNDKRHHGANQLNGPMSIYEVHLGSWRRGENNQWLSYRELADSLIPYVKEMGFTHLELMPIYEHPFDGSWGYQPIGLYAPTSRFGSPEDFKFFVDCAHQAGLTVLLDWVPAHFPDDPHGLIRFDGTALYEYADPKEGFHQDWNTLIYNFGRYEVRNFLMANALYWTEKYNIDGLRVDAVSSMLYRDYSRKSGEWIPNAYGGRENLEAIEFVRRTNHLIGTEQPNVATIAEESTAFYGVTLPPELGGLGFHYKWNMGWMNDTLEYFKLDPIYRQYHHSLITFSMHYAYSENYILPLSHDEVVHGKGSILSRMPGDSWQQFATLRAYYAFMWAHPGKKLLFMGCEFAQGQEWDHDHSLDWHLLDPLFGGEWHRGVQLLVKDLNHFYQRQPPLYELDYDYRGFEWLVIDDSDNSVLIFLRRDSHDNEIIVACNFTPETRYNYRFGVNNAGAYRESLNTDSQFYQGSNQGNHGVVYSEEIFCHQRQHSLMVTLPPLATVYFVRERS